MKTRESGEKTRKNAITLILGLTRPMYVCVCVRLVQNDFRFYRAKGSQGLLDVNSHTGQKPW